MRSAKNSNDELPSRHQCDRKRDGHCGELMHGTIPAAFKVTESAVASNGVIVVDCDGSVAITTGNL